MKVSESWLREWVNPPIAGEQLAAQLTMAGLEVDGVHPVAGKFNKVIVAQVIKTEPHPQADKLTLCEVNTGENTLKIVCGARNVRTGLKVALALTGANLPGGFQIKETQLRGQLSQGMLCSNSELGLEDSSEGILELPDNAPIGTDLREYLALDDYIFDIDLTPNRADCFSTLGVAREISALNKLPLKEISGKTIPPASDEILALQLEAEEACPQYFGRIIRDINPNAETPMWMKERLRRCGIRSLHPVVDVTNYVMLEFGQPMHAFDLQTISRKIQVRYANPKEHLNLLNGQQIELQEKVLVIADEEKVLALAGIMGGEDSAVSEKTTDVFFESAFFNPIAIAGVARQYSLFSDSSQRFERGVDPGIQGIAIERATELLLEIAGGTPGPVVSKTNAKYLPMARTIKFNPEKVKKLSGVEIPAVEMEKMLQSLGMRVNSESLPWEIITPTHRFDITLDVDLVEEIIRLNGYDNIAKQPMVAQVQAGSVNTNDALAIQLSDFFSTRGYNETISYSFVDPEFQSAMYPENSTMELLNPISQELSHMRVGLWPGLIASMLHNTHRQQTTVKLFELGVVFEVDNDGLNETLKIAGLISGDHAHLNWSEPSRKYDFFDLKGDLQALFKRHNVSDVQFQTQTHPTLHPGKSAQIFVNGKPAGWLGVLHPKFLDVLDLVDEVSVFELSIDVLADAPSPKFKSISKYPQIKRDLSFLIDQEIPAIKIEAVIKQEVPAALLKGFEVFDVYMGKSIPEGYKSLAISIFLQDEGRTLVDDEINRIINAIINKLVDEFAIQLRD